MTARIKVCCICREPVDKPALSLKQSGRRGKTYHYCEKCACSAWNVTPEELHRLQQVTVSTDVLEVIET